MSGKYQDIAELLHRRIENGDYQLAPLPSERRLAAELGVGYMTARRAVQKLIDEKRLTRTATGRLQVPRQTCSERRLTVAMVLPAFEASPSLIRWRNAVERVICNHGGVFRPVTYVREDDPALLEVLDSDVDGIFLIPQPELSPLIRNRLRQVRQRVVTIWDDLTDLGIPCVSTTPKGSVRVLIEHIERLGHSRIDCFNTQPVSSPMATLIDDWSSMIRARGLDGVLHNYAVKPFEHADVRAYEVMRKLLAKGDLATSLFCTTLAAAIGVQRAAFEHGLRVGVDLSVATFGEVDRCRLLTPSVTTMQTPDPSPYIEVALNWIRTGGWERDRPLLIEPTPDAVGLFMGETTGPAPEPPDKGSPPLTATPRVVTPSG